MIQVMKAYIYIKIFLFIYFLNMGEPAVDSWVGVRTGKYGSTS